MRRFINWIFRMLDVPDWNHPNHPRNRTSGIKKGSKIN
jgi:hypothetical protein